IVRTRRSCQPLGGPEGQRPSCGEVGLLRPWLAKDPPPGAPTNQTGLGYPLPRLPNITVFTIARCAPVQIAVVSGEYGAQPRAAKTEPGALHMLRTSGFWISGLSCSHPWLTADCNDRITARQHTETTRPRCDRRVSTAL